MIVYDDVEPTEKIKVYDSGYKFINDKDPSKIRVDYRIGDIHIPKIELQEGLSRMAKDFIDAILYKKRPISNAKLGLEVVRILSLAQESLRKGERPVDYK